MPKLELDDPPNREIIDICFYYYYFFFAHKKVEQIKTRIRACTHNKSNDAKIVTINKKFFLNPIPPPPFPLFVNLIMINAL